MSRVCQITGKKVVSGNNVSHSNKKTKRSFIQTYKLEILHPEEDKWVTLKVSAAAIRNINKKGISAVMAEAKAQGHL